MTPQDAAWLDTLGSQEVGDSSPTLSVHEQIVSSLGFETHPPEVIAVGFSGFGANTFTDEPSGVVEIGTMIQERHPNALVEVLPWDATEEAASQLEALVATYPGVPVVIYGHSFGGDSALELSQAMQARGLEVTLVETIDPVGLGNDQVPANVSEAYNYWSTSGVGVDSKEIEGAFNVAIAGTSHTEIDNDPLVQENAIDVIDGVVAFSDANVYTPNTVFEAAYVAESGHYVPDQANNIEVNSAQVQGSEIEDQGSTLGWDQGSTLGWDQGSTLGAVFGSMNTSFESHQPVGWDSPLSSPADTFSLMDNNGSSVFDSIGFSDHSSPAHTDGASISSDHGGGGSHSGSDGAAAGDSGL